MKNLYDIIQKTQEISCVTGFEEQFRDATVFDGFQMDDFGNYFFIKKGLSDDSPKILIEAHRDEIGFCVSEILSDGFLLATPCGGFDRSILPGTEFEIFGKTKIRAIASAIPPHLSKLIHSETENDRLLLDTGLLSGSAVKKKISIGDPIHFYNPHKRLGETRIVGRGLDNKASVCSLLMALESIKESEAEICFLLSVGEESSSYGVKTFCNQYKPNVAIVVDVGFGYRDGLEKSSCISMQKGPLISFTDTLSDRLSCIAVEIAEKEGIPCQRICEAGGTGTSATAIQIAHGGTPSLVLSIPLFNMHTPSEIVDESDIVNTSKLICALIKNYRLFTEM